MQLTVITNLNEIKALKTAWMMLFEKVKPDVFFHHSWAYNNYKYFDDQEPLLITVHNNDKNLIGIFPFSIKKFHIKFLSFRALTHGVSSATDYSNFLVDPEVNSRHVIKRVLEKLITLQPGRWDLFKIDNLSDQNDTANLFKNMALKALYAGTTATTITPKINLEQGYLSAKKIANLKRRFNKIADDCIIKHVTGPNINTDLLTKFSLLHKKSYPDSAFDKRAAQEFYHALLKAPDFSSKILLSYIEYKKDIIAAHFGFMDEKTFYYYVPTYDASYSIFGPGQYLLRELICLSSDKKLKYFDFLRGDEDYKFDWTNKINTNHTIFGVPKSAGILKKTLVNLWLVTKEIPFFKQPKT